ncbi:hypothetical protein ACHAWF_011562 [Thalassiosira exigua]
MSELSSQLHDSASGDGAPQSSLDFQSAHSNIDPFDDVGPSTVAVAILFGSITFATVGMAARAVLWGDKRAIRAAISTMSGRYAENKFTCSSSVGNGFGYAENHSYSVASHKSPGYCVNRIHTWEPKSFVSTFVLFSHATLVGLILFLVYIIENHPPHMKARHQSNPASSSSIEFDEDQFSCWLILLLSYGYFVSWQRNIDRPNDDHKPQIPPAPETISEKSGQVMRRRKFGPNSHVTSKGSKSSVSGTSSGSSDVSKRLEDVLLDDDASFNQVLDTIDDIKHKKSSNAGWMNAFGLHFDDSPGPVQEVHPDEDILNKYQTLEWKGLLSAALLIYKYNSGDGVLDSADMIQRNADNASVHGNLANVGMTSFLFLTGYCHTSYFFYHPAKLHCISRVLHMIFRVLMMATFLSLVTKRAYTACPVIVGWFLIVWLSMRFQQSVNYDKYLFRLKLFGLACCIFLVWDCDVLKPAIDAFQPLGPVYYLSHLHHWAAFCGMTFAVNSPIASLQLRKLESSNTVMTKVMAKGAIFSSLCAAVLAWIKGPSKMPRTFPYFSMIPVLAFIYFRNSCTFMRKHHIGMLALLGKYSLEIYLLHHHAFILIPGYPRCNFLVVSLLTIFAALGLRHLTLILQHMLLPENDDGKCIRRASYAAVGFTILYVLAKLLRWAEMVSVGTLAPLVIVCGMLLYQTVLDVTWSEYCESGVRIKMDEEESTVTKIKISPPLIGTLVFAFAWCIWSISSSSLGSCGASVNDGHWIAVSPCLARGMLHRKYHATNFIGPDECPHLKTGQQWAWLDSQHERCSYRYRNELEVRTMLHGTKILFVGDSSVRSIFLSLCRFMGDSTLGGYEETHSDSVRSYGSTTIEYKWAPLSADIVTKLRALKNPSSVNQNRQPDLVVAGGGSLDKLHLSVTDEDPKSQQELVNKLVKSLSEVDAPVVWFTPPTINTKALNGDDKRLQMGEASISQIRRMYNDLGVTSSVSFVLDGPSFTHEKMTESFDGVHYPPSVYDAGSQILLNALDWIMPTSTRAEAMHAGLKTPKMGSLGLGLMVICVALIGLFFFDSYFGLSYLAQLFVMNDTVSPGELYEAAFSPVYNRLKLKQENGNRGQRPSREVVNKKEMIELIGPGRSSSSLSRRR